MYYVTVLKKDGTPASPTIRGGRVRYLLDHKMAKVVKTKPFTIQLTYDIDFDEGTQGETLGTDPGRINIGLASVKEDGTCTMKEHVETRNEDIPKQMKERAAFRRQHRDLGRRDVRQRRAEKAGTVVSGGEKKRYLPGYSKPVICKSIKNKKARYSNRRRPPKLRLSPTARHLLETHLQVIEQAARMRPVKRIVVELNRFAFMALDDPDIHGKQYQGGPLYGYTGLHEAVSAQQGGKCLLCGKPIDEFHHLVPLSKGGSDTIDNVAGLCECCHPAVHKDAKVAKKLADLKNGMNQKYGSLSVLNQIIPFLIRELKDKYPDKELFVTTGRETYAFRTLHGIDKTHEGDAYCIACSALEEDFLNTASEKMVSTQEVKQFRRQDRQVCHKEMVDRVYCDENGREVCRNRHKRIEQKTPSIAEYRLTHNLRDVSRLTAAPHPKQYKDPKRVLPGAVMLYEPRVTKAQAEKGIVPHKRIFVMQRSDGKHDGHPDYYVSTDGKKYSYRRCRVLRQNTGLVFL